LDAGFWCEAESDVDNESATSAMRDDSGLFFDLPSVRRKKVAASFEGGRLSSDGGVLLLREVERRLDLAGRLASCMTDRRDPARISHELTEMLRTRMFLIAAGYEDGDDCDAMRDDPAFKLAVGRLPESDAPLCSQPTMSRLENAPRLSELVRMSAALIDLYCASFAKRPSTITLDIDDTFDEVHGHQQLSLFNAHYDGYGFLPIHIYDGASGKPVAVILRPAKTPSGREVRRIIRHVVGRIRKHWPKTNIVMRGDSHYGRPEAMEWCEDNGVSYIFGLAGNTALHDLCRAECEDLSDRWDRGSEDKLRRLAAFAYGAKSWIRTRRVIARMEVTADGLDTRYIVTSLKGGPRHLYEDVYCARGRAENWIKLHKSQLASDRTSCSSAHANQFRLILHTGAYWLMHRLRAGVVRSHALARAEFATVRLALVKIAARVSEGAARIRVMFASACPHKTAIVKLATKLRSQGP
jgi:hypothetical protein